MTVDAGTSSIIVTEKDDTQNDTTLETQINDVSASRKKSVLSNNDENLKSNIEDDDEVVIRKEENINLESSPPNYVEFNKAGPSEKIESLIVRTNASYMTNQCIDKSTQTEWSSVLLEAKRHEDGHYSFHLPPLSVLKYYFW
ncbi:unnamed protein product [Diatraea saccharalis]|uniref:Uncharacterized protein n=1 Tax=Diatraea saccharalis TaxID=40085 RepID=A0A9N9N0R5_9NEOP|nr:unnamed protein product [Diatraea saccharalis]